MASDAKRERTRLVSPLGEQPRRKEVLSLCSKPPQEMKIALIDRMVNLQTGHGQAILDAVAAALKKGYGVEGAAKVVVAGITPHKESDEEVLRQFKAGYDAAVFAVGD